VNQEISVKFPSMGSRITRTVKGDSEYKIFVREIDLPHGQNALITKTYEEALFLLFYNRFPNEEELNIEQKNLYDGCNAGEAIFYALINKLSHFECSPMIQLQILMLTLSSKKEVNPFFIIGAAFSFVALIVNKHLRRRSDVEFNKHIGLVENLIKTIGFSSIANEKQVKMFENMMIAWHGRGREPISCCLHSE